jgi:hypothetical protein
MLLLPSYSGLLPSILHEQCAGPNFDQPKLVVPLGTKGSSMATTESDAFSWFDIPRPLIEPTLRALLGNTAFDALFYDVSRVVTDLFLHGSIMPTPPTDADKLISPGCAFRSAWPRRLVFSCEIPQSQGDQHG